MTSPLFEAAEAVLDVEDEVVAPRIQSVSRKLAQLHGIQGMDVTTSNTLARAAPTRNLSNHAGRLFMASVAKASDGVQSIEDGRYLRIQITADELAEAFPSFYGGTHRRYQLMSAAVIELLEAAPIYLGGSTGPNRYAMAQLVSAAKYDNGAAEIDLHPSVVAHIHGVPTRAKAIGGYCSFRLAAISSLRSSFELSLYSILRSHCYRSKAKMSIVELRELTGEDKYPRFVDFKRYVLEPSIRNINLESDIRVRWTPEKVGRSFASIIFDLEANPAWDPLPLESAVRTALGDLGVPARVAADASISMSAAAVADLVATWRIELKRKGGKIESPVGYLVQILRGMAHNNNKPGDSADAQQHALLFLGKVRYRLLDLLPLAEHQSLLSRFEQTLGPVDRKDFARFEKPLDEPSLSHMRAHWSKYAASVFPEIEARLDREFRSHRPNRKSAAGKAASAESTELFSTEPAVAE